VLAPGTLDILKRVSDLGIEIMLATGRPRRDVPDELLAMPELRYLITLNGSCVADTTAGRYISRSSLDYPLAQELLAFLKEHIQYVHLMCDDRTYVRPVCAMHTRTHFEAQLTPEALAEAYETLYIVDAPMDHMKEHAIVIDKVVVNLGDAAVAQSMLSVVARQFGVETAVMEKSNFEITARGVNKATGIEQIAQHVGFAMGETVAIGDSGNDILMLQSVGYPIAMGNASDEVKSLARMIAPPVTEGGAVTVLEELFFS